MGNCLFGGGFSAIDFEDGYIMKPTRVLAEGGFSTIYLAKDINTQRHYTLKSMVSTSTADEAAIREEIRILHAHTASPHIIDIICETVQETHGERQHIYAMPFYQRGTVFDYVSGSHARGTPLPEQEILSLFLGLCRGLQSLHSGVGTSLPPLCHRDIKPHNVLLDDSMQAILIDFGSCQPAEVPVPSIKEARQQQELGEERSSLPFRAPELLEVKPSTTLTLAIDIWALGCTLYSMAFLDTPFEYLQNRGGNLRLAIMQARVSFPSSHRYSSGLLNLITSLIKEQPARRPAIAKVIALVEELLA